MLVNMIPLQRPSPRSLWNHPTRTYMYFAVCRTAVLLLVMLVYVYQKASSKSGNVGAIQKDNGTILKMAEVPVVFWDQTRDRNIRLYVLPDHQTAIIEEADFCPDDLFLLVFVSSAVGHFRNREVIRKTWASVNMTSSVKVLFMLGDVRNSTLQGLVEEESKRHGDVIQEDFVDHYCNLTLKVTMMLKWIDSHCSQISYLLKADDDIFVDLEGMVLLLQTEHRNGLLMGKLFCDQQPHREPTDKWYCPRYLFNLDWYPKFLSGPGYVMSADVIRGLYRTVLDTPFFHLDDVFFTGILPRRIGLVPRDHTAFVIRRSYFNPLVVCHRSVLLYILQSNPKEVEDMWDFYKATKSYCSELKENEHLYSVTLRLLASSEVVILSLMCMLFEKFR